MADVCARLPANPAENPVQFGEKWEPDSLMLDQSDKDNAKGLCFIQTDNLEAQKSETRTFTQRPTHNAEGCVRANVDSCLLNFACWICEISRPDCYC